jgi:UDP-glucose 4-epimerase
MKKAFVIGGAGFVGSHLVRRLLQTPGIETVEVYDNFSSGTMEHLAGVLADKRVAVWRANVRDYDQLRVAMRKCDTVFHLAANPDISRAVKEPTIDFEQGTVLTQNVLEAMRVNVVKRLVYFSGSGVYGDFKDVEVRENHPCAPISTYGASKLASEAMIHAYCSMFGLTAKILRPANIVGPRQTHGVGYDFLRKLRDDPKRLLILGNGLQSKSYIHVDDVIEALMCVMNDSRSCAVYNLAADDYLSVHDIAVMAVDLVLGENASVKFEYTGGDRGWKGDVPVVRFDCRGLKGLGWKCRRSSREAMMDALQAMLQGMAMPVLAEELP